MAPKHWVIRLPLAETEGDALLVRLSHKDGEELDLDLLATDGDVAYRGKVRTRNLSELRAANYEASPEEWTALLKYVLVSRYSADLSQAVTESLDVSCNIKGKDPKQKLTISFRTKVQDITQKLGSIDLSQSTDTDDVDLFSWASQAIDQRDKLEVQAAAATTKEETAKHTIASLQSQLDELVKAKSEHEEDLLAKFALLLNEKKLQLRKLQRQMATAKLDPKKLEDIERSLPADDGDSPKRSKKRSARDRAAADSDESDEAFEAMDIDKRAGAGSGEERDTTDTESAEEDDLDPPPRTSHTKPSSGDSSKPTQPAAPVEIPPRRELPFQRKDKQKADTQVSSPPKTRSADKDDNNDDDDDEETASEEDEL